MKKVPTSNFDVTPSMRDTIDIVRGLPDNILREMANLLEIDTGVSGTIYISTEEGTHGPRIKWFPGTPGKKNPCLSISISDNPVIRNFKINAHVENAASKKLMLWVSKNKDKLLDFWVNGTSWSRQQVNAFIDSLIKV